MDSKDLKLKSTDLLEFIKQLLNREGICIAINDDRTGIILGTEEFVFAELDQTYDGTFNVFVTGEEQWPNDPNNLN